MTVVSSSSIRLPAVIQEFSSSAEYRNSRLIFENYSMQHCMRKVVVISTTCNYNDYRLVVANQTNKIIMNGDVHNGYEKIILAGALGIAALSGTNVPGLEVTKASAASIESNFSTLEGRVVEVDNGVIIVKSKQYEEPVSVYMDSLSNVKVGDEVKATGSMMRNFTEYMVATAFENTTNKLGMHMKEDGSPDYVIGEVSKIGTMEDEGDGSTKYVVVEYPSLNGKKDSIDVFLTKGQVFHTGEKVKIDMKFVGWGGSSINWNTTDNIEKVHEVKSDVENNDDVWIWS